MTCAAVKKFVEFCIQNAFYVVELFCMKTLYSNKIKYIAIALLAAIMFACVFMFFSSRENARADDTASAQKFLHGSDAEYYDFGSAVPSVTYYWDNNYAMVLSDGTNRSILFYIDGEGYTVYDKLIYKNPYQLKYLGENIFLVSDNGVLFKIDLTDLNQSPVELHTSDTDNTISGTRFDLNDNYLVTVFGTTVFTYKIEGTAITDKDDTVSATAKDVAICINDNDEFFYIDKDTSKLKKYSIITKTSTYILPPISESFKMIADTRYVYFSGTSSIYRVPVSGGAANEQLICESSDFDLGKISQVTDIAFKNGNLLVTDSSIPAVQEFAVTENLTNESGANYTGLTFTGFAIASGKTAYNRIGATVSDVERYENSVALLDGYKLTVVLDVNASVYDRNNFFNYVSDYSINLIAIGDGTILVANASSKKITLINYVSGEKIFEEVLSGDNNILDLAYSNGYYYVLKLSSGTGNNLDVFKFGENALTAGKPLFTAYEKYSYKSIFAVDADDNVYITSLSDNAVYRYTAEDDFSAPHKAEGVTAESAVKIQTDLIGGLFILRTDDTIDYYKNETAKTFTLSVTGVKSFALTFNGKDVYLVLNNKEFVYKTNGLSNVATDDITVPAEFVLTAKTADVSRLKTFTAQSGKNLYGISPAETRFNYHGLRKDLINEYVYICSIDFGYDTDKFSVLAGETENGTYAFVLVADKYLTETTLISDEEKYTFVTSDVCGYYLPIIAEDEQFVLSKDGAQIRLTKNTRLTVKKSLTFLNKKFYYAEISADGETVYGYVPAAFTVDVLSEDVKGSTVTEALKGDKDNALRNALIIIALSAAIISTSLFFVLRKQK